MSAQSASSPVVNNPTQKKDQKIDDLPAFKKKRLFIPLFILLILVAGSGWFWYAKKHTTISTDDSQIDANRATISAKMLGRITELKVEEEDTVHQGDTLVLLDNSDLYAQIAKAEAAINSINRTAEMSSIALSNSKENFNRMEKQYKNSIIPQEQFNHGEQALKLADAQYKLALSQIGTAKAELSILKTQLNNTVILATFDGVIAKKWVMPGDVVQPGQAIYSLYDMKNIWITANYEETKLQSIHPGLKVQITVDAFPGIPLQGRVLSIGKTTAAQFSLIPASNASGNFTKITQRIPVKISIDKESAEKVSLLPGLSVSVNIFPGK